MENSTEQTTGNCTYAPWKLCRNSSLVCGAANGIIFAYWIQRSFLWAALGVVFGLLMGRLAAVLSSALLGIKTSGKAEQVMHAGSGSFGAKLRISLLSAFMSGLFMGVGLRILAPTAVTLKSAVLVTVVISLALVTAWSFGLRKLKIPRL